MHFIINISQFWYQFVGLLCIISNISVHGDAPKYISDLVCRCTPPRALRSANSNLLTVVWTHVKGGDKSFAVAAARPY